MTSHVVIVKVRLLGCFRIMLFCFVSLHILHAILITLHQLIRRRHRFIKNIGNRKLKKYIDKNKCIKTV
jgi:hypothetical protein